MNNGVWGHAYAQKYENSEEYIALNTYTNVNLKNSSVRTFVSLHNGFLFQLLPCALLIIITCFLIRALYQVFPKVLHIITISLPAPLYQHINI